MIVSNSGSAATRDETSLSSRCANRTEAAKAWIWNSDGAWAAGWICRSPLFRDAAAGCLEVG